jgi:hypothetical protein
MIQGDYLNKELQEFILSFNTTVCLGIALIMCILMKNYNNAIEEDTIYKIGDVTIKFMPTFAINLLDKLHKNEEITEELSPV